MKHSTWLLLILLPVLSQGWEVAVGTEIGLAFLGSNGTILPINKTEDTLSGPSIVALAVDPSNKRIFLSISSPERGKPLVLAVSADSIGSDPVPIVNSEVGSDDIQGLAYNEVGKSLYWTDNNRRAILWANLSGDVVQGGKVLHQLEDSEDPIGIAVDGCHGFVFWTNSRHLSPSIERSNLDGASRETIVARGLFKPLALALDMSGSGRIFWTDNSEGIHYKIETSRLDGTKRTILVRGQHHTPYALAFAPASGEGRHASLFWSDWTHESVWQISLEDQYKWPKQFYHFKTTSPMGLIAAAALHLGHSGNETERVVCPKEEALITTIATTTTTALLPVTTKLQLAKMLNDFAPGDVVKANTIRSRVYPDYCIYGEPMVTMERNGAVQCKCRPGYSGQRCENSVCHNYCIHGSCRVERRSDGEWEPKCECRIGFSGRRCEYDPCRGYCLNRGRCRIEDDGSPQCTCVQLMKGDRCERRMDLLETKCSLRCSQGGGKPANFVPLESVNGEQDAEGLLCPCPSNPGKYVYFNNSPRANFTAAGDREKKFESSDSPFVLVLGVLCVALLIITIYLACKVFSLRRLPRIKKRIIVSKGSVPLAAGCGGRGGSGSPGNQVMAEQQQCEITIENCCNMNICETPCFEPQLRSPGNSGLTNKSGKEEKKMLLANMDVPKSNCGPCQGTDELY